MPYCKVSGDGTALGLLFASITVGALSGLICGWMVFSKWFALSSEERRRKTKLLSMIILFGCFYERTMRISEVYLMFHRDRFSTDVIYYLNNGISIPCIVIATFILLTYRLKITFRDTVHEVPKKQLKVFYGLTAGLSLIVAMMALSLGLQAVSPFPFASVISAGLAVLGGTIGSITAAKLDLAFVTRLRSVVVNQTALDAASSISDLFTNQDSALSRIRGASLDEFAVPQRRLLQTAVKSTVIAIWVSLSAFWFCLAVIIFSMSTCDSILRVIGQMFWSIGIALLSVTITVGIAESWKEYRFLCHSSDQWIGKVVAYQTVVEVRRVTSASQ